MAQGGRANLTLGSLKFPTPAAYNGKPEEWEDWNYKFKSYMNVSNYEYGQLMKAAETATEEVTDTQLTYQVDGVADTQSGYV